LAKVNFLSNKEILQEIHKSKNSYCYYVDKNYGNYDIIVLDLSEMTQEVFKEIRSKRSLTLIQQERAELKSQKVKVLPPININPSSIPINSIIVRVVTDEHVPFLPDDDPSLPKQTKNPGPVKVKTNFIPFKHYIVEYSSDPYDEEVDLSKVSYKEVGRSHWKNGLSNGEFCLTHGNITNRLAQMYLKLVDKYGQKPNWRNYCVDDQTKALTKRGWLGIDEINESDMIASYSNGEIKWSTMNGIYRGNHDGNMFKLTQQSTDMLVTPGHKLMTSTGLTAIDDLKIKDRIILMGDAHQQYETNYTNDEVELFGWIVTDGNYDILKKSNTLKKIAIYQNKGPKADRIRNCLNRMGLKFYESCRNGKLISFCISRQDALKFQNKFPEKEISMDFINNISTSQRELLLETMILGDGWIRSHGNLSYYQKKYKHIEILQALCVLLGRRSMAHFIERDSFGNPTTGYVLNIFSKRRNQTIVENINFNGGKVSFRNAYGRTVQNIPTEPYTGRVWCPSTEFGCFIAKRNETIYLTGNSYLDEMKNQALLQLIQVGLKFDERRSQNPFAYYTTTMTNSFTGVFHREKRNQTIRDDILTMRGQMPSYTRMIEHEISEKGNK
jgi:hypothetical protein